MPSDLFRAVGLSIFLHTVFTSAQCVFLLNPLLSHEASLALSRFNKHCQGLSAVYVSIYSSVFIDCFNDLTVCRILHKST